MVKPVKEHVFTKKDLRDSQMGSLFFNTLFNLNKLIAYEQRDPQRIKQVHATPHLSDWDRYAIAGYYKMAESDPDSGPQFKEVDEVGSWGDSKMLQLQPAAVASAASADVGSLAQQQLDFGTHSANTVAVMQALSAAAVSGVGDAKNIAIVAAGAGIGAGGLRR